MMIHQLSLIEGPFDSPVRDSPVVAPRSSGGTIGMPQSPSHLTLPDSLQSDIKNALGTSPIQGKAPSKVEGLIITFDEEGNPGISLDHDDTVTANFLGLGRNLWPEQENLKNSILAKIKIYQRNAQEDEKLDTSASYKMASVVL